MAEIQEEATLPLLLAHSPNVQEEYGEPGGANSSGGVDEQVQVVRHPLPVSFSS